MNEKEAEIGPFLIKKMAKMGLVSTYSEGKIHGPNSPLHSFYPGLFFFIFVFGTVNIKHDVNEIMPMIGFDLRASGVGRNCSANWATDNATAHSENLFKMELNLAKEDVVLDQVKLNLSNWESLKSQNLRKKKRDFLNVARK